MIDFDTIEKLARLATHGKRVAERRDDTYTDQYFLVRVDDADAGFAHSMDEICVCFDDIERGPGRSRKDAEFIAALDPATVLELVALARMGAGAVGRAALMIEDVTQEVDHG